MCEKGTSLSQLSFTEVVISFSTWQAEQKKIGKEDSCICCTVSQTYGGEEGNCGVCLSCCATCYTTPTSVGRWMPTGCECRVVVTWIFWISNQGHDNPCTPLWYGICLHYPAEENVFVFLCAEGGVWGRRWRKGRPTWLVSHQARPVHQGDRRD